jgi:pyruvyl transferase EpsO
MGEGLMGSVPGQPGAPEITATAARLRSVLDPLVPLEARVALLDFPFHSNVGDSAIWAGERAYLRTRNATVVYRCTWRTYDAGVLRRQLGNDGIVLFHGGGNFGDLYLRHQRLRERVLADLPDQRIIQLPQTVNFSDEAARAAFGMAHATHEGLVVLVRDRESQAILSGLLAADPQLAPDMAFALGPLTRTAAPSQDVLALLRADHESTGLRETAVALGLASVDWLGERWDGEGSLADRATDLLGRGQRLLPSAGQRAAGLLVGRSLERRVVREVDRGRDLLSRGRVVLTDRLHAHLLCYLMGIPHVVLADRHGKVTRASALWVGEHPWIRHAATLDDARAQAQNLLSDPGAGGGTQPR